MTCDLILFPSENPAYQDLEIEILASFLRKRGWTLRIEQDDARRGGGRIWYHHFRVVADQRAFIRRTATLTDGSPIQVAGGYLATREDEVLLKSLRQLDAVIRGDPERHLDRVLRRVTSRPVPALEGLTVRNAQDQVCRAPLRGPATVLHLPAAADDLYDDQRARVGQRVLLSRGCYDYCEYCGLQHSQGEDVTERWRSRASQDVIQEIEHYYHLGARRFVFQANVFFGYDERGTTIIREVCRGILDRALAITFRFVTHPHHLLRNRDLLPLLLQSGLEHVYLGIDSGSPAALERYRVPFTTEDGIDALRLLHEYGVSLTPGFIFYDPLAAWPEILEQLTYLRRLFPLFGHRAATYPLILEKELLNQYLKAHAHTPLLTILEEKNIVIEKPREGHYLLCFTDPKVAAFHRLHRRLTRQLLAPLRPLTWRSASVAAYPQLSLLPLDLLDRAAQRIENDRTDASETIENLTEWLAEQLTPDFEAMRDLVDWPAETPQTLRDLLTLGAT